MVWYLLAGRVRQVKSAQFMAITYTDEEIVKLTQERKVLPNNWRNELYKEEKLVVNGNNKNKFRIIVRQNKKIPLDFSAILAVFAPQLNRYFKPIFSTPPLQWVD